MANAIELVSDGDGVLVAGDSSAVARFLGHVGLLDQAHEVDLARINTIAKTGADAFATVSAIVEQSAMYLKLTPDSARRLKDGGGLMKTKTKGISHAMLGESGKKSLKWLQVEDGPGSIATNPAVLSGVAGLLSQFAQQSEAQELKALLLKIDGKLDDVRRAQRDAVIARMRSSAAEIDEAMVIRAHGGDPQTLWDKVSSSSGVIKDVQEEALLALGALADKVEGKSKSGELKRTLHGIEGEVAVQLAVLARCFELQDQFKVIELDHVLATAPQNLAGHRRGVEVARQERRASVLEGLGALWAASMPRVRSPTRTSSCTHGRPGPLSARSTPRLRSSMTSTLRSASRQVDARSMSPLGVRPCAIRRNGWSQARKPAKRRRWLALPSLSASPRCVRPGAPRAVVSRRRAFCGASVLLGHHALERQPRSG